jgi:anti-anti-sigma factor
VSGRAADTPREATIALSGDLDLVTAAQAQDRLQTMVDTGVATIAVDLHEVTFMDSIGVNTLVITHRQLRARGGGLIVVRASAPVRRVLEITGLAPIFGIDESKPAG